MLVPLYSEINAESPQNGIWINFTHPFLRIEIRSNTVIYVLANAYLHTQCYVIQIPILI